MSDKKKRPRKKKGDLCLSQFPCVKCPLFKTKDCIPIECVELIKYEVYTDIACESGNKDFEKVTSAAQRERGRDPSSFSSVFEQTSLSKAIDNATVISFNAFSELVDQSGIFRPVPDKKIKSYFMKYFECPPMAEIARLAGQTKQNIHKMINSRIKKLYKKQYAAEYKKMKIPTPDQYKKKVLNF